MHFFSLERPVIAWGDYGDILHQGKDSEITVVSDNGKSDCGNFSFKVGERYLIYATALEDRLAAWATTGSPNRLFDLKDVIVKSRLKELNSFWFRRQTKILDL